MFDRDEMVRCHRGRTATDNRSADTSSILQTARELCHSKQKRNGFSQPLCNIICLTFWVLAKRLKLRTKGEAPISNGFWLVPSSQFYAARLPSRNRVPT